MIGPPKKIVTAVLSVKCPPDICRNAASHAKVSHTITTFVRRSVWPCELLTVALAPNSHGVTAICRAHWTARNRAIDDERMPRAKWIGMPTTSQKSAHPTNGPRHQCNRLSLFSFKLENILGRRADCSFSAARVPDY